MSNITMFIKDYGATFGFISALSVYALGRLSAANDRKRSLRPYIKTDSINANYNLANYNLKENTKLILTEEYKAIMDQLRGLGINRDSELNKGTYLGYLQVKNLGPGFIIDAEIEMHMSSKKRSWSCKTKLPFLEVGEEVYLSTGHVDAFRESYRVEEVKIVYQSQQNEVIKYVFKNLEDPDNPEIKNISEAYYKKVFMTNIFRPLFKTKGKPMEWIILKSKK